MFSKMFCLNVQIRHHVIKKCTNVHTFLPLKFDTSLISLNKSENTINSHKEIYCHLLQSPSPLCLVIAGVRDGDPMGDSYRCGFIRPGWYITHLSPHGCYGFLGPGWRNSLHYDVPAAGLRALLQHLQWLRCHCGLLG